MMRNKIKSFFQLILAAAVVALGFPSQIQAGENVTIGVNNVHLGWLKPAQREQVLDEMAQAGVQSVRVDMVRPYEDTIDALSAVEKRGMSIELVVSLTDGHLVAPRATIRPGRGSIWPAAALSELDINYFRTQFGAIWQEIEKRGIHLSAVELGNEINWAAFNGDLAVVAPGQALRPGAPGLAGLINPAAYSAGLQKYVQALSVVKQMRDASAVNRHAVVLSAGLASMSATFAAGQGAEYVDAVQTLARLKEMGLDAIVDGYGIHSYPDRKAQPIERKKNFDALISLCGVKNGHSCWLTEWGVAEAGAACVIDNAPQVKAVIVEMNKLIASRAAQGKIAAAYYFDWDGATEPYAIWRCGHLTENGKAVLRH